MGHFCSLNTVSKTMVLKRSSAAGARSTFMRRIAPSQEANRNSARSTGSNLRIDLPHGLRLRNTRCERGASLVENFLQSLAEEVALRTGFQAEVADQAAAAPLIAFQPPADDLQVAFEVLS